MERFDITRRERRKKRGEKRRNVALLRLERSQL